MIHDIWCGDSPTEEDYTGDFKAVEIDPTPDFSLPVMACYQAGIREGSSVPVIPNSLLFANSEFFIPGTGDARGGYLSALKKAEWDVSLSSSLTENIQGGDLWRLHMRPYSGDNEVWRFLGMSPVYEILTEGGLVGSVMASPSTEYPYLGALACAYMTGFEVSRQQRLRDEATILKADLARLKSEVASLKALSPQV
ncbi:MAG: hypothetical protein LBI20_03570 [Holosporales bacterium]|nr:hypothetical protein [Holosporales bacterium]